MDLIATVVTVVSEIAGVKIAGIVHAVVVVNDDAVVAVAVPVLVAVTVAADMGCVVVVENDVRNVVKRTARTRRKEVVVAETSQLVVRTHQ